MDNNDSKVLLIKYLQDHIASLEKQLNEKQTIIEENTKIIANLISFKNVGYRQHRNLHDNQLLQNQSLKQVHDIKATPITIDITDEQKNQQNTKNKKGKKKPNQQKDHDAPQKNQTPDETQSSTVNNKESKEAGKNVNKIKNNENDKGNNKRLYVTIVGDSLLNGIDEKGLSRHHIIKVKNHPGANMEDIADHVRPVIRRKPDLLIIHAGTNDLTKGINTAEVLRETITFIKKESPETQIAVSTLITRHDKPGMDKKVQDINRKIKVLCVEEKVKIIDNSNLDEYCLGRGKLHLNRKGKAFLARNFISLINH